MPTYTFKCAKGHKTDWLGLYSKRPASLECPECGRPSSPSFVDDLVGHAEIKDVNSKWPVVSHGAAVHPSQVEYMRKRFPKHIYRDDGKMEFTSWSHQDRCLRDRGMVNLSQS